MLDRLFSLDLYVLAMVFARIGSSMVLMPGIGETYVPPRARLILALWVTFLMAPLVKPVLPAMPPTLTGLLMLMGEEIFVGLFLGSVARILLTALSTAGTIVAFMTGISNIFTFDPVAQQQGSLLAKFLSMTGVLVMFATNTHYLLFEAVTDSYNVFIPGHLPPVGDFSNLIAHMVAQSFALGVRLAAPFIVVSLVFYVGLGVIARLMPQIQIFFVAQPLQIGLGLLVLVAALPAMMMGFLAAYSHAMIAFMAGTGPGG